MIFRPTLQVFAVVLAVTVGADAALAHKATDNHSHCTIDGFGIGIEGATDAERKLHCAQLKGAQWDETKPTPIDRDKTAAANAAKVAPK